MRLFTHLFLYAFIATSGVRIGAQVTTPVSLPEGGGHYEHEQHEACLTAEERAFIEARLMANVAQLQAAGKLPTEWSEQTTELEWPLEVAEDLPWPNYFGISGFVDQDLTSGIDDYNCGGRSYDGHSGTDYFTWPFPWYQYNNDFVSVVAAAPGTIIWRQDQNFDKQCVWGNNQWNAVYVQHADGTIAWYGHLKQNGLTDKEMGDAVEAGEFLGYLASSGRSSGPHLHLEIRSTNNTTIDPYAGNCNDLLGSVSWAEPQNYKVPTINALLTHDAPPSPGCPDTQEATNFSNSFDVGQIIYIGAYYRDQLAGTSATFTIRNPDGVMVNSWVQNLTDNFNASWWWWTRNLAPNAMTGTYTIELSYQGQTEVHEFEYGVVSSNESVMANEEAVRISPNPTSGLVQWSGSLEPGTLLKLYSADGQLLDQRVIRTNGYNLAAQAPGIYFLQFERGGRTLFTRRVVRKP